MAKMKNTNVDGTLFVGEDILFDNAGGGGIPISTIYERLISLEKDYEYLLNKFNSLTIQYRAHCATIGWQGYVNENQTAGTVGENREMQAIQIKLVK